MCIRDSSLSTPHCVRVSRLLHDPRLAKKIFYIINKYNYYKFYRYPLNEYSVCCQFSMLGLPPLHANRIPSPYFSPEPLPRSFATPCPCFSSLPALPYPGTVSPTYGPPVRPSVNSSVRPRMATSTGGYHTRSHSWTGSALQNPPTKGQLVFMDIYEEWLMNNENRKKGKSELAGIFVVNLWTHHRLYLKFSVIIVI